MNQTCLNNICLLLIIGVAFCNALEPKNIVNKVVKQFRKEPSEVSEESFDFDNVTRDITTTFDAYCPGGSEMFEEVLANATECFVSFDIGEQTICSASQTAIPTCLEYFVKLFESCLKEEAKTLPRFFVKSLTSAIRFVCNGSVEQMFELGNTCYVNDTSYSEEATDKIDDYVMKHIDEKTVPSKTSLCRKFISVRSLVVSHVEECCANTVTKNAFIGLYDAVLEPCAKDEVIDDTENQLST